MQTLKELYYHSGDITVERSTRADAEWIAANMRKDDAQEIWASHHSTPAKAMAYSIEKTIFCLTVKIDNKPAVMFGVNGETVLGNSGIVWMLATDDIKKIGFRFVRHSKMFLDIMMEYYPYLYNYVDVRNITSMAWLKRIGATFEDAKPFGIEQKPFCYFYFRKES